MQIRLCLRCACVIFALAIACGVAGCSSGGAGVGGFRPVNAGEAFTDRGVAFNAPPGDGWHVRQRSGGDRTETTFTRQADCSAGGPPHDNVVTVRSSRLPEDLIEKYLMTPEDAARSLAEQAVQRDAVGKTVRSNVSAGRFGDRPCTRYSIVADDDAHAAAGQPVLRMDLEGAFFVHPDDRSIIVQVLWSERRAMDHPVESMTTLQRAIEQSLRLETGPSEKPGRGSAHP